MNSPLGYHLLDCRQHLTARLVFADMHRAMLEHLQPSPLAGGGSSDLSTSGLQGGHRWVDAMLDRNTPLENT